MQEKQLNIVHLLYCGLGGHGSVFFSLLSADKTKEFTYGAIFGGIEPLREDYKVQCEMNGIPFFYVHKKEGIDGIYYKKLVGALFNLRPDVLFLHNPSYILPALIYKAYKRKVKIIVRDTQAHHLKTKADWFFLKYAVRFTNHLVFLTKESRDGFESKLGKKTIEKKAVVIPNGVDIKKYTPAIFKTGNNLITIGMQSRLQKIKDHPTLFRAFQLVKEKMPHQKLKLHIAGDGETMQGLQQLANDLGLANDIVFAGMLNEEELIQFMQELDIYVHATFGETMSNSIMQAMACGLPVIASDVWGVNNMIHHEQNGLLYTHKNELALASTITQVITDEEQRNTLSHNARKYAEEEFSNEKMFANYKPLFKIN